MKITISALFLSFLLLVSCNKGNNSSFSVSEIKCNGMENPEGTGKIPRFSWITISSSQGAEQKAYQLIVSSDRKKWKEK